MTFLGSAQTGGQAMQPLPGLGWDRSWQRLSRFSDGVHWGESQGVLGSPGPLLGGEGQASGCCVGLRRQLRSESCSGK